MLIDRYQSFDYDRFTTNTLFQRMSFFLGMYTPTEQIVLYSLNRKVMYGSEILRHVSTVSGGKLVVQSGTLYQTLAALEEKDLIVGNPGNDRSTRSRIYYGLTDEGASTVQWLMDFYSGLASKEDS